MTRPSRRRGHASRLRECERESTRIPSLVLLSGRHSADRDRDPPLPRALPDCPSRHRRFPPLSPPLSACRPSTMLPLLQPFACRALASATRSFTSSAARRALHSQTARSGPSRLKPVLWGSVAAVSCILALQSAIQLDADPTQADETSVHLFSWISIILYLTVCARS